MQITWESSCPQGSKAGLKPGDSKRDKDDSLQMDRETDVFREWKQQGKGL